MTKVSVNEATKRLPELLDEVDRGEEVIIAKGDGATYKITVVTLQTSEHIQHATEEGNPPFAALRGAGGGKSFRTAEEVNAYIHSLRNEWEF